MKSKSQEFADAVFPNVQAVAEGNQAAKYKTLTKKAGSLVRNSGLIQTLAFFRARGQKNGEEHHLALLVHLEQELKELSLLQADDDVYLVVRQAELAEYMVLTREILLLLNWHKRLSETLIQAGADNGETAENTEVNQ